MKKLVLAAVTALSAATAVAIFAQSSTDKKAELPADVQRWEQLAEKGDTAALHKLLHFLDDNALVYLEVEEVVEAEVEDGVFEVVDDTVPGTYYACDSVAVVAENPVSEELEALYSARLDHWLAKGLAAGDPVAFSIKGMRLYYGDENEAITYLAKAAEMGDSRAALFCGSALFNQGRGNEAIKYLTIADSLGEPSAGWHLAMCYAGNAGVEEDMEKAIQYLVKSALCDYPEAIIEMRRIDPDREIWKQKADSLKLETPDFTIITAEYSHETLATPRMDMTSPLPCATR